MSGHSHTNTSPHVLSVDVILKSSIVVRSLLINGTLLIQPDTKPIIVDAAFVIANQAGSKLTVRGTDWKKTVTFYLRRNAQALQDIPTGADEDAMLSGARVLAGTA